MARRKEVFQAKVLQKLFPKCPKEEREPTPPSIIDELAKKSALKRKEWHGTVKGDGETIAKAAHPAKRVYTVLPPPAHYKAEAEGCESESINAAEKPAESTSGSSDEPDEDRERGGSRRRRRRNKKRSVQREYTSQDREARGGEPGEDQHTPGQRPTPTDSSAAAGGERLSRNRKRKLKKRRHKEKLLSLGLVPRAAALEFTYQKDGELERKEQDEGDGRRAAEVPQEYNGNLHGGGNH